ncbi:MAG: hypothetical protein M3433_02655 [Actinomycetota bacterium]|nr:hypothetical protein [Actinomycetota bacterium]
MTRLVDAATVADALGVSRAYVYANAADLGALRLGTGPRARLRFDLEGVLATVGAAAPDVPDPQTPPRTQHDRGPTSTAGSILKARGGTTRP